MSGAALLSLIISPAVNVKGLRTYEQICFQDFKFGVGGPPNHSPGFVEILSMAQSSGSFHPIPVTTMRAWLQPQERIEMWVEGAVPFHHRLTRY